MRYLIGLSLGILLLGGAGVSPASAADAVNLVSTTTRTCIEDTEGFDANLQPTPLPSFLPGGTHFIRVSTHSDSGQGVFNLDGTLSSSFDGTSIRNLGMRGADRSRALNQNGNIAAFDYQRVCTRTATVSFLPQQP